MQARFDLVCGPARSGTSAMMLCLKNAGINIGGFKYPLKVTNEMGQLVDAGTAIPMPNQLTRNPKGMWEYSSIALGGLKRVHQVYDGEVVKVLLQALTKSDPNIIGKVIFMMRHPRNLLTAWQSIGDISSPDDADMKILSLINNSVVAVKWMANMIIDFKIVIQDEMRNDTHMILKDVCMYLGKGNPVLGTTGFDKQLIRSKKWEGNSEAIDMAEDFYKLFVGRSINQILNYDLNALNEKVKDVYVEMQGKHN